MIFKLTEYDNYCFRIHSKFVIGMENRLIYKIHVYGHVQGVGFRWSAAKIARIAGISGFVKNLSDGSVYIEAEGTLEQLNTFAEWCKKGPGLSIVESISVESAPAVNYPDFRIES
jgi:acylphosphatase